METPAHTVNASTLAVGTEITDGQILDRNSNWIAQRLIDLGVSVVQHRAVPDERGLIRRALEDARDLSDLIFVTGGLGPTSDDFTREVIAEVFNRPLEWDETSWQQVNEKLNARGVPVRESQRQQCFFPLGSDILFNSAGTANAFCFEESGVRVFGLPGPPTEIAAIWKQAAGPLLQRVLPPREPEELLIWRCLGKGESEIADMTESVLKDVDLRIGYRAHAPYVEVKVWVPNHRRTQVIAYLAELERTLFPWVVNRQGEDLADDFLGSITALTGVQVWDAATGGLLNERLSERLRDPASPVRELPLSLQTLWQPPASAQAWLETHLYDVKTNGSQSQQFLHGSALMMLAADREQGHWLAGINNGRETFVERIRPPYIYKLDTERGRKFITEAGLQFFLKHLS